ncbi:hypothetical protein ElyMa_006043000, partial [Elysia marginata]
MVAGPRHAFLTGGVDQRAEDFTDNIGSPSLQSIILKRQPLSFFKDSQRELEVIEGHSSSLNEGYNLHDHPRTPHQDRQHHLSR